MGSEATAAAEGQAAIRRDPMAMLPFCGYNMADYFGHWLSLGRRLSNVPKMYRVNWFLKDEHGRFMWPGFGQNLRVLAWIIARVRGQAAGIESPVGLMPRYEDLNWQGLEYSKEQFLQMMGVEGASLRAEAVAHEQYFERFFGRLPPEFVAERELLYARGLRTSGTWKPLG
jgi:phosphoenolpyruvate carboxykinase (GTP)